MNRNVTDIKYLLIEWGKRIRMSAQINVLLRKCMKLM